MTQWPVIMTNFKIYDMPVYIDNKWRAYIVQWSCICICAKNHSWPPNVVRKVPILHHLWGYLSQSQVATITVVAVWLNLKQPKRDKQCMQPGFFLIIPTRPHVLILADEKANALSVVQTPTARSNVKAQNKLFVIDIRYTIALHTNVYTILGILFSK